jgi:hypothetical protein
VVTGILERNGRKLVLYDVSAFEMIAGVVSRRASIAPTAGRSSGARRRQARQVALRPVFRLCPRTYAFTGRG